MDQSSRSRPAWHSHGRLRVQPGLLLAWLALVIVDGLWPVPSVLVGALTVATVVVLLLVVTDGWGRRM